ncbi:hypothetical protein LAZ67_13000549 [Cordylochernes scorpioides]|uniref:DDE-1 domain-containing protein n=1 Tax=Cordylochernes scorpioides TaxID=51811 RepID=A0ABY6L5H7_9ARAC|nr:hypothetical protein LAZ67_13000549 [Cordylochernes scorpioides]
MKMEINPGASTTKGNDNPREKELTTNGKKLTTNEATRHTLATVILELTAALQGATAARTAGTCPNNLTPTELSPPAMPYHAKGPDPGQQIFQASHTKPKTPQWRLFETKDLPCTFLIEPDAGYFYFLQEFWKSNLKTSGSRKYNILRKKNEFWKSNLKTSGSRKYNILRKKNEFWKSNLKTSGSRKYNILRKKNLIPDRTLAHKDENCRGVKRMKQRITILLCCNSTGTDNRRLLIIGKSAKPRCFRNFSPHFYCTYTSNSKAWMTSSIFQEWLLKFNKQLVSEGRRILLLLDNATSHCVPNDGLSNIKIHFLPPNMTASLQPLDSGIIKSFKAQYRKLQLQKMVELADAHLPTELRLDYAVRYCKMAWDSVSPDSSSNCWNHTGIIRFTSTAAVEPLNYGNLLDRIRDIFAITPENLMTEREFQLVDDSRRRK